MKLSNGHKKTLKYVIGGILLGLFILSLFINYSIKTDRLYKKYINDYNQIQLEINKRCGRYPDAIEICSIINFHDEYSEDYKCMLRKDFLYEYGYYELVDNQSPKC